MTSIAARPPASPAIDLVRRHPVVAALTLFTCAMHLALAGRYDIMRNELYFIVCGWRPAFGYVDQPPLAPLIAAATQLFGENVWLLRLPAALAATVLVPLAAAFARLLGGDRTSAILAAAGAALAPALMGMTTTTTTSTFEPICWTLCAFFLTRCVVRADRRALLWAAIVAGLAMAARRVESDDRCCVLAAGFVQFVLLWSAQRSLHERDARAYTCCPNQMRTSIEERWSMIDGYRMRYLRSGSGPAVVLVHGLLGYSFSWRHALPVLSQSATVYAVDMLGTGFPTSLQISSAASARMRNGYCVFWTSPELIPAIFSEHRMVEPSP